MIEPTLEIGDGNWAGIEGNLMGYYQRNAKYYPRPLDFTRASTATRVNEDGLIEEVASGMPRIDYLNNTNGQLLLEPQRTNLITDSEDMSDASWVKLNASVTANNTTSPDGTSNADLVESDGTNSYHLIGHSTSITSGNTYTFSTFAKKGSINFIQMQMQNVLFTTHYANFDVNIGVITFSSNCNATIEDYGNGWFKCSVSATAIGSGSDRVFISPIPNGTFARAASYTDVISAYIWGVMLEQSDHSTSYIPTAGATATRIKDASRTIGGLTSVINSEEGVIYFEASALANDNSYRWITLGSLANRISIGYGNISNKIYATSVGTAADFSFNVSTSDTTENKKIALKYSLNDVSLWINGVEVATDNTFTPHAADSLNTIVFDRANGGYYYFYGRLGELIIFPTALTDAELTTLTTI